MSNLQGSSVARLSEPHVPKLQGCEWAGVHAAAGAEQGGGAARAVPRHTADAARLRRHPRRLCRPHAPPRPAPAAQHSAGGQQILRPPQTKHHPAFGSRAVHGPIPCSVLYACTLRVHGLHNMI